MPTLTPNYSFNLPLVADPIDADLWGGQLNSNWTKVDTLLGASGGLSDANFRINGSVDATKKLAFEVDGLTTATTRTLTVQDVSGTVYVTGGTDVAIADGGTGASTAATAFDNLKQAATTSATGVIQLATAAEVATGTDAVKAVTPATMGSFGLMPKAFCSFVGGVGPTVNKSYNIASIVRTGAGVYNITFTNAVTAPYIVLANAGQALAPDGNPNYAAVGFARTSTGFVLRTGQPSVTGGIDVNTNDFIVF